MPGFPGGKRPLMEFFARKGYWVFNPRWRGSWESGGKFLRLSPERDVRDVMEGIGKGFRDLRSGARQALPKATITLVGVSFGGAAALLLAPDPRVLKVIAVSPVVDWRSPSRAEPIETLYGAVKREFGEGYRMARKDWDKLKTGKFYNPAAHAKEIDGGKVFIFHAKDDCVVRWGPVAKFARATGARLVLRAKGGHFSMNEIMKPSCYKIVRKFLRS